MNMPGLGDLLDGVRQRLGRVFRADPLPTPALWEQIQDVLTAALDLPPTERAAFLDSACAGRPMLRHEVESLLTAHEASGILDRSAAELIAPLLPSPSDPAISRGRAVAHYQIIEKLGDGGMGVVYKARDPRLERMVALKFLPPHLSANRRAKERFRMEAQAAAVLDHPNICTIHEIGEADDEGRLFIAMPFYEGETLKRWIGRGPLPVAQALDFAIQAVRGLARAHERGIVHRDIKPANLMVTPDGTLKILDFGIAKLTDVSLTNPGVTPGTVAYMSPEQARGEAVDARTDIWSWGVVLYEMLTGTRPFGGDHDQVVLHAILHADPPPVTARRSEVPIALERIVGRMLAKSPRNRYTTAQELLRELERVRDTEGGRMAGIPVFAPPVHPAPTSAMPSTDSGESPAGVLPEGERRQITVVVSTLSGYAGLVERLVPEEVEAVMDRIRAAAADIAARHGGVVNQFTGDEMVLLFGIPTTHEDDSLRATRAALELRDRVRSLSAEVERRAGPMVRLHTGIDSGRVVAQPVEGRNQVYRVAGTAARVAARLSTSAAADEVWITPECQRRIGPFFETEGREPLALRDRDRPLVPYRVVRESGLQTRLEAAEREELTAYTGREEETATLACCLHDARRGEGRFVTVAGEAGLGKSRLLFEFRQHLNRERVSLLQGRCQSYGGSIAYLPFIETLRDALRPGQSEPPGDTVSRIREIGPELEEFIPLYLYLLSIPSDEFPVPKHLHGEQFRLTMQEALAAILTLSARQRPAVVLLEDWHWVDEASHTVLEQVAEMIAGYPLLVVVTCRPGYVADWGNPSHHASISLRPLDVSSSIAMLGSILEVDALPEDLGALLHERTGGNPFFLEEICQTLIEDGTLRVEEGRVLVSGSLETLDLPDTVQAVIRTRLDRLDREARETLRLASVAGREFTRQILETTLADPHRLFASLDTLKATGLIQQTRVVPEAAYRFKHILTQEVVYGSLLEHQRRDLHGRVGDAIERVHHDRIDEHLDRLAYHFSGAEEWRKAVHYGLRSAERAGALSQFSESLGILERSQGWLARLPEDSDRQETSIRILLRQERLCETLGLRGRQQQIIDALIALLESSGDRVNLAEAYVRQGDLYTLLRRFDEAEEPLDRSLHIRRELGDAVGERNTLRSLGLLRWHQGRNREAAGYMEAALAIDRQREDLEAIVGDLSNLGYVLKGVGDYERARTYLEEGLRLSQSGPSAGGREAGAEKNELMLKRHYLLHNLANLHRELGDDARALEYLHRANQLGEERTPIQVSYHYTSIAHIYLQQGRIEESLHHYREAVDLTRKAKFVPGLAQSLRFLGEVLLGLDRRGEALPHLQEAAGLFAQLEDQETEARMWSQAAVIHEREEKFTDALAAWGKARTLRKQAGSGAEELEALEGIARVTRRHIAEPSLALGYYREALELAEALRDRVAEGRLRNAVGILEWEQGNHEAALAEYEAALALFQDLGDSPSAGLMLNSIGVTLRALGRQDEARTRLEEALAHHRRTEQPLLEGHALAALGALCGELGETGRALDCYGESLRIRRAIGDRRGEGWMSHELARVHLTRGSPAPARDLAARASAIAAECGDEGLLEACEHLRRMPGT